MTFPHAGQYTEVFINQAGLPLPATDVFVYDVGTSNEVGLYTNRLKSAAAPNPFLTDSLGNGTFYAEPGQYDIVFGTQRHTIMCPVDPADAGGGGGGLPSDWSVVEPSEIHSATAVIFSSDDVDVLSVKDPTGFVAFDVIADGTETTASIGTSATPSGSVSWDTDNTGARVVVGFDTQTVELLTDVGQAVAIFTESTTSIGSAPDTATLFARDNGAGKTQLCVQFHTGVVAVIATEP